MVFKIIYIGSSPVAPAIVYASMRRKFNNLIKSFWRGVKKYLILPVVKRINALWRGFLFLICEPIRSKLIKVICIITSSSLVKIYIKGVMYIYSLLISSNNSYNYKKIFSYTYLFKRDYLIKFYNFKAKYIVKINYFFYFFKKILYIGFVATSLTIICILFFSFQKIFHYNKTVFVWFLVIYSNYLLYSGFIFFMKKYQYGKYVSAIQRYWKRTYIVF